MNLEKINVGGNEYDICDAKTRAMVSDEYDPEGDYVVGDLCIHDNKLYEATGPTTGAWDSTKWEGRTLAEVLKSQNSKTETLTSNYAKGYTFPDNSSPDDLISYARSLISGASNIFLPIGTGTTTSILPSYSPGFIIIRNDTFVIALFQYSGGRVYISTGSKTTTSGWKYLEPIAIS